MSFEQVNQLATEEMLDKFCETRCVLSIFARLDIASLTMFPVLLGRYSPIWLRAQPRVLS